MRAREPVVVFHPARAFGGVERFLALVLPHWRRRHRLTLVSTRAFLDRFQPEGVEVVPLAEELFERRFRTWPAFFRLLRAHPGRVLVFVISRLAIHFALVARLLSRPVTLRYDGLLPPGAPLRALALLNRLARRIVVPGRGVAGFLARRLGAPRPRLAVLPNPFPVREAEERLRRVSPPAGLAPRPRVLWMGRLHREKNFHLLVRAAARVRRASFLVLGDGPDRKDFGRQVQEAGLEGRFSFLGFQRDVFPFLAAADAFVHTCSTEGFGYSILEALAAGLPVVAQDCPCGPDEVLDGGRCGLLVKDANDLAFALEEVLSDRDLRLLLARRARRRVRDFDLERYPEEIP